MEPLFLAVVCGCNAGLYREALHDIYIRRIQRGAAYFAAKILAASGVLLSVLGQFFENGRWESPVVKGSEEHSLSEEDELFIRKRSSMGYRAGVSGITTSFPFGTTLR
jgi:hypothetical protein